MTRNEFLKLTVAVCGGVFVAGCGSDDPGPGGGNCVNNGTSATIQTNHGHTLSVPKADVTAAAEKIYDITGASLHPHSVTVTAANFASLAANQSVTITSTSGGGHTHTVVISCA